MRRAPCHGKITLYLVTNRLRFEFCWHCDFMQQALFQDVCGELIGVHQTTASRTLRQVTEAILRTLPQKVRLPNARECQLTKEQFFQRHRIPNVLGCIDGTQIPIQSPGYTRNEHEYVNRKGYHSIDVQVICDAASCQLGVYQHCCQVAW